MGGWSRHDLACFFSRLDPTAKTVAPLPSSERGALKRDRDEGSSTTGYDGGGGGVKRSKTGAFDDFFVHRRKINRGGVNDRGQGRGRLTTADVNQPITAAPAAAAAATTTTTADAVTHSNVAENTTLGLKKVQQIRRYDVPSPQFPTAWLRCPLTVVNVMRRVPCTFVCERHDDMQMHLVQKHPNNRKLIKIVNMNDLSCCELCPSTPEMAFDGMINKLYHYHFSHNDYIQHFCPNEKCRRPFGNLSHLSPWAHRKNHHKDDQFYISQTLRPFYSLLNQFRFSMPSSGSSLIEINQSVKRKSKPILGTLANK